ncbi:MAG: DUF934 domain-containing protein [Zavarzinia sp.]|nr:DUF934 domain-containing protein [Zavarzinia sp.]
MKIVKEGAPVADTWTHVGDEAELPDGGAVIVSLARFKAERDALMGRNAPLGLRLASHEPPADVAEDLGRFEVVALEFPVFRDGRGYTHAVQLRQRFAYRGEVRALGDVLWDQIPHMLRCGVDTFEVADDFPLEAFEEARTVFSNHYQPDTTGRRTVFELRHG